MKRPNLLAEARGLSRLEPEGKPVNFDETYPLPQTPTKSASEYTAKLFLDRATSGRFAPGATAPSSKAKPNLGDILPAASSESKP
ncbi:MAG: hypothetical protein UV61_C0028G0005 [Candidatus Gottesmanbacteria bacterium GW2011_GWB1_43_11]|uniref:Uncharacterized protein n=1 Tax=Candidatus Gottesmanbacteria bacterium GW2011_GWB1_43_11 TaxID=1618446 RepID=A0A0G1CGC9_9BACT|nr:MAG: hypothetical protein UV17_C0064G0004 [Candidatus Gottesmanbacteria bacterium GW2011_GWA1_42_26]KKS80576.1 MAG: hypothetical protein UV55_C0035G0006 [Candidatus Gottesmanbacteria bacterium GW2011_GWC1_43_10]KKS84544.1 MAG: hypothetical protein UV61_C0028G0005 [Candidatus Gottesmanbacteria bacterium GW2011_GWB1_43_11]OGG09658.1 MAG: hypothetical protein A2699_02825 [Candidatus Gottesmanbacteria bacterium RIFCSPHIGHO2_01_FULL_43_15]HCM37908.1 hypothetical protein [Patescibacteria group bac